TVIMSGINASITLLSPDVCVLFFQRAPIIIRTITAAARPEINHHSRRPSGDFEESLTRSLVMVKAYQNRRSFVAPFRWYCIRRAGGNHDWATLSLDQESISTIHNRWTEPIFNSDCHTEKRAGYIETSPLTGGVKRERIGSMRQKLLLTASTCFALL